MDIPTVEKPAEDAIFEETSRVPQHSDDEDYISVENLRDSVKDWFKDPYEPVLNEQDYVHLRHAEAQHVEGSSSTPKPKLLPHQIRWNRVLQEANSRWANPQFRAPYLEDVMANIFRKTKKPEDLAHIHLILEMTAPEVKEYVEMLKLKASRPETVTSRHPIIGILQVSTDKIFHVEYPVFQVRRQDGNTYTFNEADFPNLDTTDLETIYLEMKDKTRRTREEKLGYRALVRFIQRTLRYSYLHDFQRAVESGQRKVHLLRPTQQFTGIERHIVTSIIKHPFHGVVWMHSTLGEKRVLRFDEIAAYSDGTLTGIRNRLQAVISEDRKKEPKDRLKPERRNDVIQAIELIDKRILYRSTLRRFEGIFELRR